MEKLPTKKQIQMLRLALGMAGCPVNDPSADLILRVQAAVKKKGGKFDLHHACDIQAAINEKYWPKKDEEKKVS